MAEESRRQAERQRQDAYHERLCAVRVAFDQPRLTSEHFEAMRLLLAAMLRHEQHRFCYKVTRARDGVPIRLYRQQEEYLAEALPPFGVIR